MNEKEKPLLCSYDDYSAYTGQIPKNEEGDPMSYEDYLVVYKGKDEQDKLNNHSKYRHQAID